MSPTGHGEGEITRNAFTYDICEALAYLVCVLNEREQYQIERTRRNQTIKYRLKYFTHRLFNVDTRFTTNVSYLSYALYVTENKQVDEAILIAVRMKKSLNIK